MEKIPTAEEFLIEAGFPGHAKHGLAKKWMIEFAKLHVEAALKEASEGQIERDLYMMREYGESMDWKSSILNSYPLDKIK